MRKSAIILILGFITALSLAAGATQAAVIHVPGDQPTIAAGLGSASSGDIVLVACGTYEEHSLSLPSGVTLRGDGSSASCVIIDAQGLGRVMEAVGLSETVTIENLTLRNGLAHHGAGLKVEFASAVVGNCHFDGNVATSVGGGLHSKESDVTVTDCLFTGNSADADGGGLNMAQSELTLTNSVFDGNTADYGGALVLASGSPLVEGCRFLENSSTAAGGAIVTLLSTTPTIRGCLFDGNSSVDGGAIYAMLGGDALIETCTFVNNAASTLAAGVLAWYSNTTMRNCIVAFSTEGEGVACDLNGQLILECCDIYGNAGGDWVGCAADQLGVNGNFSEDPLFCLLDNPVEPYTVSAYSSCAEVNNPECGQIGAFGFACGLTATEDTSISHVKSLY